MPEANFQAEFYHYCVQLSIPCVLEYGTPAGRHDACIFSEDFSHLRAVVECKNNKRGAFNPASRQYQKYKALGVPIYELCSLEGASDLAYKIFFAHVKCGCPTGRPVAEVQALPKKNRNKRRPRRVAYIDIDEDLIIRA